MDGGTEVVGGEARQGLVSMVRAGAGGRRLRLGFYDVDLGKFALG